MKPKSNVRALAACLLLILARAPAANAQDTGHGAADRAAAIAVAREIATASRYATLTTVGSDGHPQSRIVDPFEPDGDFTIWVGTNRLTRKVAEIAADPRVTLLYFNAPAGEFVTVVGRASIVTDSTERARLWKDEWAAFYEGGPLGDRYVLIRVRPERLEVVSPARGILNDPDTWRPVTVAFP